MKTMTFTLAAVLLASTAFAQTMQGTPGNTAPGATSNAPMTGVSPSTGVTPNTGLTGRNTGTAAAAGDRNQAVATTGNNAPQPARGNNSYTMGQARGRIERAGFTNVTGLKKDDGGVWRGTGSKSGTAMPVWLDYKGNVGQSDAMGQSTGAPTTMNSTPGTTPGTTSGTATGTTTGTMGNNAVGRGVDRTLGTNATGTNPAGTSAISR